MATETETPPFSSLGLSPQSLKAVERAGYQHPTPIQVGAIPLTLAGKDVIGCAATGTGKTAAFVLPILQRLGLEGGVRALVLSPTRELAVQIAKQVGMFGATRDLRIATLIGGIQMGPQIEALEAGAQFVIATPGRLVDHLDQGSIVLDQLEVLVLDEADRMLDMGFQPQLTRILKHVPAQRQTLLFSATMAEEVARFAKKHLKDAVRVEVTPSGTTAERADQRLYEVSQGEKTGLLLALLADDTSSTLVFTRTKRKVDKLAMTLAKQGHKVERLHADRSQGQRRHALEGFREGRYRVLVATDVAARGIDVAEIGHVVNYDLPHDPEDYVHRVGRTARAQASGRASTFAAPDDAELLAAIEKVIRGPIPRAPIPRDSKVFQAYQSSAEAKQRDPGPPQPGHGISTRPPGQEPGRHARSHLKKK
ncbi:MAG: DEAD/DEAH box helicase [Myxococcota bacterium]|nr:DEAD/DEAH box helicase [Myxococcota bacterium]